MIETRIMDSRFFHEISICNDMAKLRAVWRAIPKWEDVAAAEVEACEKSDFAGLSSEQRYWHEEHISDRYYELDVTKEALFGSLAVLAASAVEQTMGMFCKDFRIQLQRNDCRNMADALEKLVGGEKLADLPGFDKANQVRLLANCFKHNGGRATREHIRYFARAGLRQPWHEIRYQDQPWQEILDGIEEFLMALVERVPSRA